MGNIEIYCNNRLIDLGTGFTGIRMNNVVFNPTELRGKQAEYSFTFNIPSTRNNDEIFVHANVPSQSGKFRRRFDAMVYADGVLIFDGSLVVKSYKDGNYSCNLVSVKIWSNEEIFGDAVLSDIPWEVDFNGAPTINEVNADPSKKYAFPLICYGAFAKNPYDEDEVGGFYTPKGTIDKYNQFWYESFYPSLNVLETIKKAYEWKGYQVAGTAFQDPVLSNIYASTKLSAEQVPQYNLGNPKFGRIRLSGQTSTTSTTFMSQDLTFPYFRVDDIGARSRGQESSEYNFTTINIWSLLDNNTVMNGQSYMYDPKTGERDAESAIVIPADGFYDIWLEVTGNCETFDTFTAKQWRYYNSPGLVETAMTITPDIHESTPIEIQLVRNYKPEENSIELIKGGQNVRYYCGDPSVQRYGDVVNRIEWETCFPHQKLYGSQSPTVETAITDTDIESNGRRTRTNYYYTSVTRRGTTTGSRTGTSYTSKTTLGYISEPRGVMPYDPAVSPIFICGMSTMMDGTAAVIKDGYSWSRGNSDENESFYNQPGLKLMKHYTYGNDNSVTSYTSTEYCRNEYKNAINSYINVGSTNGRFSGKVCCCVYLHRNDVLELFAIQRDYERSRETDPARYKCNITYKLDIKAMSPRHKTALVADDFGRKSEPEFPEKLHLGNFMSDETRVSEWVDNVCKTFNITTTQNGNLIQLDKTTSVMPIESNAVELDGKCDSRDAELSQIEYPSEMSVRWTINKDEYGFELTVPKQYINEKDWYEHGDSGYTIIKLNDDTYSTSTLNEQVPFSYTYWQDFTFEDYDTGGTLTGTSHILTPVIELSQYMAEGYGYKEAMEHDGYSLAQRFFYRPTGTTKSVKLADSLHETVNLYVPERIYGEVNISYKDSEKSLLTQYFNCNPRLDSNFAKIDVYIDSDEYLQLRGGSLAHFDSDLYYVSEISGYDPSGKNPTTLKLMKKT